MRIRLAVLALALMSAVGCQGPIAPGYGRVSGLVGAAPATQGNQIAPAAGKTVLFIPAAGGQAHIVKTGSDGHYSVDLGVGTYEVRLDGYDPDPRYYAVNPNAYWKWPKVTVTAGHETRLDLIYNSG